MSHPVLLIGFNTFREIVRNKILYAVVAFAFLLITISALFGSVTIGDQVLVIRDFGLFALTLSGAIIVSLSGVTLLDKELRQKTVYNLLSKPVARTEFVVGKFLGLVLVGGVVTTLMGLLFVGFLALFSHRIDWALFQAMLFIFFELILLSAVAIFFSSLVVTTVLSGLFTFGAFLAGHSHQALNYFLNSDHDFSSSSIIPVIRAIQFLLPDLGVFNLADRLAANEVILGADALSALIYALSYAAALLAFSILIFRQRDFQ